MLGQLLDGELDTEVVRDRVEAARVDDARTGLDGSLVVGDVHPVDELGLAGQVEVVRACVRTGRHQLLAVLDVGADRGDHDLRRLGQLLQRLGIGRVGVQDVLAEAFQLRLVAAGNCPREVRRGVLRQVLRGQGAGEPAGAQEHDVVRHRPAAFSESASPPAPDARVDAAAPRASMSASAARSAFGTLNREPASITCGISQRNTFIAPIHPGTCTTRERLSIPRVNLSTANSSGYTLPAKWDPGPHLAEHRVLVDATDHVGVDEGHVRDTDLHTEVLELDAQRVAHRLHAGLGHVVRRESGDVHDRREGRHQGQ